MSDDHDSTTGTDVLGRRTPITLQFVKAPTGSGYSQRPRIESFVYAPGETATRGPRPTRVLPAPSSPLPTTPAAGWRRGARVGLVAVLAGAGALALLGHFQVFDRLFGG